MSPKAAINDELIRHDFAWEVWISSWCPHFGGVTYPAVTSYNVRKRTKCVCVSVCVWVRTSVSLFILYNSFFQDIVSLQITLQSSSITWHLTWLLNSYWHCGQHWSEGITVTYRQVVYVLSNESVKIEVSGEWMSPILPYRDCQCWRTGGDSMTSFLANSFRLQLHPGHLQFS